MSRMAIYKRGRIYYYHFLFNSQHIQIKCARVGTGFLSRIPTSPFARL